MPTNSQRAARFESVLHHYQTICRKNYGGDHGACLADLLTDANHYAAARAIDFPQAIDQASFAFGYEKKYPKEFDAPSKG